MNQDKIHATANVLSVVLFSMFWHKDKRNINETSQKIIKTCGIKEAVQSNFDTILVSDEILADPTYTECRKYFEPIAEHLNNSPENEIHELLNELSFKEFWGMNEALPIICNLFRGQKVPFYLNTTTKKEHLLFHYFVIGFLYTVLRVLKVEKKEAYNLASKYARFAVVGLGDKQLLELYHNRDVDLEEYCKERGLIFNVVVNALTDLNPNTIGIIDRCFLEFSRVNERSVALSNIFTDSGVGICRKADFEQNSFYFDFVKKRIKAILENEQHSKLRDLISKSSVQDWQRKTPNTKVSIRYIGEQNGKMYFKFSQLDFVDALGEMVIGPSKE